VRIKGYLPHGPFYSIIFSQNCHKYSKMFALTAHLPRQLCHWMLSKRNRKRIFKARSTLATMSKQQATKLPVALTMLTFWATMSKQRSTLSKGRNFNAKLVWHCWRFWQQSRTLLRGFRATANIIWRRCGVLWSRHSHASVLNHLLTYYLPYFSGRHRDRRKHFLAICHFITWQIYNFPYPLYLH